MRNVAKDNDLFRTTFLGLPGKIFTTPGVRASEDMEEVLTKVREHNIFTEDNDPYGEHDFGAFTVNNVKYFWKIDYYDDNYEYGADPKEGCKRVLTIMRADEY